MVYRQITSSKNPYIKELVLLKEKSKTRKLLKQFLIEGEREIHLAINGDIAIETLLFCADLFSEEKLTQIASHVSNILSISKEVYQKLAHRETTEGLLAVANAKELTLNSLTLKTSNPLILVAEAPEKPGNIGALLRTADAARVDAVIIANPKTDLYNPNIIRSSVGCVFTNQIAFGSTTDVIRFLKKHGIAIYGAALQASVNYDTIDYTKPTAIVVGTEATGLTQDWLNHSTQNVVIPMQGAIDSMNVSVAAGILIFEAKRQRHFN